MTTPSFSSLTFDQHFVYTLEIVMHESSHDSVISVVLHQGYLQGDNQILLTEGPACLYFSVN